MILTQTRLKQIEPLAKSNLPAFLLEQVCAILGITMTTKTQGSLLTILIVALTITACSSSASTSNSAVTSHKSEESLCDVMSGALSCDGEDFSKQNLGGLILAGGSFRKANFSFANLVGVNLDGADLLGAVFDHADLSAANISRTNLTGSSFMYANLAAAKIQDTCLTGVNFDFSDLTGADFARSAGGVNMSAIDSNLPLARNWDMFNVTCSPYVRP